MKQAFVFMLLSAALLLAPACGRRACGPCTTPYTCTPGAVVAAPGEVVYSDENGYTAGYSAEEGVADVTYAQDEFVNNNTADLEELEDFDADFEGTEDFDGDLDLK